MIEIAIAVTLAALFGAASGALAARWTLRRFRRQEIASPTAAPDPVLAADIEAAAAAWANSEGRPEAAGIVADKLHLIHRVARGRGWWQ